MNGLKSPQANLNGSFPPIRLTPHQSLLEARPNAEVHQQDVKLAHVGTVYLVHYEIGSIICFQRALAIHT